MERTNCYTQTIEVYAPLFALSQSFGLRVEATNDGQLILRHKVLRFESFLRALLTQRSSENISAYGGRITSSGCSYVAIPYLRVLFFR